MEKIILYLENGENYKGDEFTEKEAKKILKEAGYKNAYSGRKFCSHGQRVIVGIDGNNVIKLKQRRENGLWNARIIKI